jgi:UDP-glucuronate decarboxylase
MQALQGLPITLFGDGSQTRSFCYVDDLIEAFIRLMATGDDITGPINLGNPNEFTIRELAEKVIQLTNSKSPIVFRPLPGDDPMQRQPNIEKAKSTLNWEPKIQLEEGLRKSIKYFEGML